ncbi:N-acetylgalactosaminyltransferase 7, partial [Octopus sinensis]|uniref:Polypeptide N-acetylgalactosaminyltransferase n=1 Tax=Octopus sinensis TaxID=2607531 RepID=A0A6P7SWT7_9MOLL
MKRKLRLLLFIAVLVFCAFQLYIFSQQNFGSPKLQLRWDSVQIEMRHTLRDPLENVSHVSIKSVPFAVSKEGFIGNYEPAPREALDRPGDYGKPVIVRGKERVLAEKSVGIYGYNIIASDKIAMDRIPPDFRMTDCKFWHYPEESELPSASVVIAFRDEGWSTLLRTIHSVINMSPPALLKEVILIDDESNKGNFKADLSVYLKDNFKDKVNLFRNSKKEGLIRSKTIGAKYASGDILVFMDAHCECGRNWLVPILALLAHNRTIVASPVTNVIDWETFAYKTTFREKHHHGIFEWGFLYKESKVPDMELTSRKYNSEPYRSPTLAGGLFAIDGKYFFELGGFDPGLQSQGGENFELSFKIWQCGGSIKWVPCSHVGYVRQTPMFLDTVQNLSDLALNYIRVVEVWLDNEHKQYFYARQPSMEEYPILNISKQLEFKKEHECKSFKWFLENVANEVLDYYPPPPPNKYWGQVMLENTKTCSYWRASAAKERNIRMSPCKSDKESQLFRLFRLNVKGQLIWDEFCIETRNDILYIQECPVQPTSNWSYLENTKQIFNSRFRKCVEAASNSVLCLKDCDANNKMQQWSFKKFRTWDAPKQQQQPQQPQQQQPPQQHEHQKQPEQQQQQQQQQKQPE